MRSLDALERGRSKRAFAIEGVEDHAFEEVAEGEVMVLGEGFEHLQDAFFHSDAGLDSLDFQFRFGDEVTFHRYPCTRVHGYLSTVRLGQDPRRILRRRGYQNFSIGAAFHIMTIGDTLRRWRN